LAVARANPSFNRTGEILGLNGGADFYGKSPRELRAEFKSLYKFFLMCAMKKA
jgi:predicted HicB family RNase H-like nuclease